MKIEQITLDKAYRLIGACPLVMVTTYDQKPNICTVAWIAPVKKDPPKLMILLGKSHKSYENLDKNGEFGINIPTADISNLVTYCGTNSAYKVDKIKDKNIALHYGDKLKNLPLSSDCAAWLECKVLSVDSEHGVIVGEVVAASIKEGVLDKDSSWNVEKFPVLHHLGGSKYLIGEKVL